MKSIGRRKAVYDPLDIFGHVAERTARQPRGHDGHALLVDPPDLAGSLDDADFRHGCKGDGHGAFRVHYHPPDGVQAEPGLVRGPYADVDLPVTPCEFRGDVALYLVLHDLRYGAQVESQVGELPSVEEDLDLGVPAFHAGLHVGQSGYRGHLHREILGDLRQPGKVVSADLDLHRILEAEKRGTGELGRLDAGYGLEACPQAVHDVLLHLAAEARFQPDVQLADVLPFLARVAAGLSHGTGQYVHAAHFRVFTGEVRHSAEHVLGCGQRRAYRQPHVNEELALAHLWNQFDPDRGDDIQGTGKHDGTGEQRQRAMNQRPAKEWWVGPLDDREDPVKKPARYPEHDAQRRPHHEQRPPDDEENTRYNVSQPQGEGTPDRPDHGPSFFLLRWSDPEMVVTLLLYAVAGRGAGSTR